MHKTITDKPLSWRRIWAVLRKEFVQIKRDRLTLAMLVAIPMLQLVMFGYAINGDPKHLPTVVVAPDASPMVRSIIRAVENTGYFNVEAIVTEQEAERWLGPLLH